MLTTLATFVATIAVWAHGVLLDTDRWVDTVGPLARDETVTDAVSEFLVDEVVSVLEVEDLARDALPDGADFLAAPLTAAVDDFVTDQVRELLATEQFARLWEEANRAAHSQAVQVLRDEGTVVRTAGGEISLNLIPVIVEVLERLDGFGLLPDSVQVPDLGSARTPVEQAEILDEALTFVDLPEAFGQITVYRSETLAEAQDAVALFDRLVLLVVVLAAGLATMSLALSPDRRRTVLQLGLAILAALVASRAVLDATTDHLLGLISDDVDRSAAAAVVQVVLRDLRSIVRWLALAGLLATGAAFVTSDSSWAVRARSAAAQLVGSTTAPAPPNWGWVTEHRDTLRVVGVGVALVWLVLGSVSFASLGVMALALGAYEGLVALVARRAGSPPAPDHPAV